MAEADGGNEFEYVTIINPYMMGWREDGKVQSSKFTIFVSSAPRHCSPVGPIGRCVGSKLRVCVVKVVKVRLQECLHGVKFVQGSDLTICPQTETCCTETMEGQLTSHSRKEHTAQLNKTFNLIQRTFIQRRRKFDAAVRFPQTSTPNFISIYLTLSPFNIHKSQPILIQPYPTWLFTKQLRPLQPSLTRLPDSRYLINFSPEDNKLPGLIPRDASNIPSVYVGALPCNALSAAPSSSCHAREINGYY
ncbi:hypothetical protein RRG08_014820 [Elysia crispata]|uniref:Uncharacterized protein n=1 Tax=Elysia crispata TaxID=231223 RepID=A0AAE1DBY2_9GAST|nr:hypothetical protein RRG08_014820 [Elysia crispata]